MGRNAHGDCRDWTAEDDRQVMDGYLAGATAEEIARRIGRTRAAVSSRASYIGAAALVRWSAEERALLRELHDDNVPVAEIAAQVGRSESMVVAGIAWLARHRERLAGNRARGPWLASEDAKILAMRADGESVAAIADEVRRTVSSVRARLITLQDRARAEEFYAQDRAMKFSTAYFLSSDIRPASLTAALLGDPLPGRSALDQRRAEEAGRR